MRSLFYFHYYFHSSINYLFFNCKFFNCSLFLWYLKSEHVTGWVFFQTLHLPLGGRPVQSRVAAGAAHLSCHFPDTVLSTATSSSLFLCLLLIGC